VGFSVMGQRQDGHEGSRCSPVHLVGELQYLRLYVCANRKSLGTTTAYMVFFSVSVQGAEGSTFGIVSYVCPSSMGSVCGIVGAGGNAGAVGFGLGFRQL